MMFNYICLALTCHAYGQPQSNAKRDLDFGETLDTIGNSKFFQVMAG